MNLSDFQVAELPTKEEILLAQQFKEQNPNWEVNQPMAAVMPEKWMQAAVATYHQLDRTFAHFDRAMRNPSHNQPMAAVMSEK